MQDFQRDPADEAGRLLANFLKLFRGQAQEIFQELRSIRRMTETIMATQDQFKAGFARIDAATTAIANKLRELKDIIGSSMTAEQEDAARADLERVAAALETMASDPTNPTPLPIPGEGEDSAAGGTGSDTVSGGTGTGEDTTGGGAQP